MRILVIGRSGQLARSLARRSGVHELICFGRDDIDLFSRNSIMRAVSRLKPDAMINAAAYTAVDRAESDRDAAYALNEYAPRLLAEVSASRGIPLIHISTDYVFDGTKPTPYLPTDPTMPLNVYGASKAAGEVAVISANPTAIILRTAWVYSEIASNFVLRMLQLGAEREKLAIVDDQIGNPTFAGDLADACLRISSHERRGTSGGVYHFAGSGEASWHHFAKAIFHEAKQRGKPAPKDIVAISTDHYPTPARRPANSRLDCSTTLTTFGIACRPWEMGLRDCMDRLET